MKAPTWKAQWTPVPDPDLRAIRQPTLVINGSQDSDARLAAGRKLAEAIPRAVRQELPGAGHLAALDNPQAWVDAVLAVYGTGMKKAPAVASRRPGLAGIARVVTDC